MTPEELMQLAIRTTEKGLAAGQSPFGCAIAIDGQVVSAAHNTVVASTDITAHAEVNAVRQACQQVGDIFLTGAIVATTCEPCPMCLTALHWARVETIYYGATIADAEAAGFNELTISASDMLSQGGSRVALVGELLRKECAGLFDQWLADPQRKVY